MVAARRFLSFVQAGAPKLWLERTGIVVLPPEMRPGLALVCSFCGVSWAESSAMAGVVGRTSRICRACRDLCCDIVAGERLATGAEPGFENPIPDGPLVQAAETLSAAELTGVLAQIATNGADAERRCNDGEPRRDGSAPRREVFQLISGPRVFICDGCAVQFVAIASRLSR